MSIYDLTAYEVLSHHSFYASEAFLWTSNQINLPAEVLHMLSDHICSSFSLLTCSSSCYVKYIECQKSYHCSIFLVYPIFMTNTRKATRISGIGIQKGPVNCPDPLYLLNIFSISFYIFFYEINNV